MQVPSFHRSPSYVAKKLFRTGKTFFPSLTDTKYAAQRLVRQLLRRPHEHDFRALDMLKDVKPASEFVFVDIGANRGQTIDSVRLHKRWRICSIEANPVLAQKLQRQRRRDDLVTVLNYAISDTVGETTLYVPKYRGYAFDGLASMIREEAATWLDASKIYGFRADYLTIAEMRVPTTTLDSLGLAPDFVKVDVQGAEMLVLKGAMKTLQAHCPILLLELPSYGEEGLFLAEIGYQPYKFRGRRFERGLEAPGGNAFFLLTKHRGLFGPDAFRAA